MGRYPLCFHSFSGEHSAHDLFNFMQTYFMDREGVSKKRRVDILTDREAFFALLFL